MAEILPGNGLRSSLAADLSSGGTTLQIASADAATWPTGGEYRAVICADPTNGPYELVRVTGGQGTATLTITRAVEAYNGDQTARAWTSGASVSAVITHDSLQLASGLTLPLTQNLTFSPDATYDVGASGANRPRDLFLGRNLAVAGTSQLQGAVGIGATPGTDSTALYVQGSTELRSPIGINTPPPTNPIWFDINGYTKLGFVGVGTSPATDGSVALQVGGNLGGNASQIGIQAFSTFSSAATTYGRVFSGRLQTAASTFTMATGAGLWLEAPSIGAGSAVTNLYGVRVENQGSAAVTNAYGIYVVAQKTAATTNVGVYIENPGNPITNLGLYNLGPSRFDSPIFMGLAPVTGVAFYLSLTLVGTASQSWGVRSVSTFNSGTTSYGIAVGAGVVTQAASFTMAEAFAFRAHPPTVGAGSAMTTAYGFYADNQGKSGVTNAYGVYIAAQSGAATLNTGLYNGGVSRFDGVVAIGGTPNPSSGNTFGVFSSLATGTTQNAVYINPTFSTAVTGSGAGLSVWWLSASGSYTMSSGYGIQIQAPLAGPSSTVTNMYGIQISNQGGTGIGSAYGLYIANQTGASTANIGLYNAGVTRLANQLQIGSANEYIRNPTGGATNLSMESTDGYVFASGKLGSVLTANLYYDGAFWQRFDVAQGGMLVQPGVSSVVIASAPSGANPATTTGVATIDSGGTLTLVGPNKRWVMTTDTVSGTITGGPTYAIYASQAGPVYIRPNGANSIQMDTGCTVNITGPVTLGSNLTIPQGSAIFWTDSNSQIFSTARTTYFDEYSSGWRWRNSSAGFATRMSLDSAGNLNCFGGITFSNSQAGIQSDGSRSMYLGNGSHQFLNLGNSAYLPVYASAFTVASARKFKDDVVTLNDPLRLVLADELHGVSYTEKATGKACVGFVADDWSGALPEVVSFDDDGEVLALDYDRIGAVTFEALKQYVVATNARLDALERKLAA